MSLINRNFKSLKLLQKVLHPRITSLRTIGDVNQPSDVNIFDVFHTKKLQKECAAKR